MTPPIPKPVLIITAHVQTLASFFVNVSYWDPITPPVTSGDLNAICADFDTVFGTVYPPILGAGSHYKGSTAEYLTSTAILQGHHAMSAVGTAGGATIGDEVSVVIQKNTGLSGRAKRGRYFISGLGSTVFDTVNPNEVNSASLADFQAVASQYGTDQLFNGVNTHARHWDRKDSLLIPIFDCTVASRLATRRNRRKHSPDFPE